MNKIKLEKKIIKIFKNLQLSNNHAEISAKALINAELVGAYGRGYQDLKCTVIELKKIN